MVHISYIVIMTLYIWYMFIKKKASYRCVSRKISPNVTHLHSRFSFSNARISWVFWGMPLLGVWKVIYLVNCVRKLWFCLFPTNFYQSPVCNCVKYNLYINIYRILAIWEEGGIIHACGLARCKEIIVFYKIYKIQMNKNKWKHKK